MARLAIYPGTFDPMTLGHLDILQRALQLFDRVVVTLAANIRKQPLFNDKERIALILEAVDQDPRVEAETFSGLLVDYAHRRGACAIVRGLRNTQDFLYEAEMAQMNHAQQPAVETVFLVSRPEFSFVSSSLVKEVATFGGDVTRFVPPCVLNPLKTRLGRP